MSVKTMKPLDAMKRDANLPNLPQQLNIKNIVSDQEVMVETEILDPITHSQSYSKFILPNKGVLDAKNSRLVWSATNPATNGSIARPSNVIGGLGFIKSMRLLIGGNEVSFVNDLNQYSVVKKQFKSLDTQKFRGEAFLKNNNDIVYDSAGGGERWFMPTNIGGQKTTSAVIGKSLTNNPNTTPKYAEALTDFLPFFSKGNQFPLFLSKQEVVLEVEWDTDQNTLIFDDESKKDTPVIQPPTLMLDLMFYGEDVVNLIQENNNKGGLNFTYNDIMLITGNLPSGTNSKNFFLGMADRTVDRIWLQTDNNVYDGVGMGKFKSNVENGANWNMRVNENLLYEQNIDQRGMEWSYLCETVKKPFNTVLGEYQGGDNVYCGDGSSLKEVASLGDLTTNTALYNVGADTTNPFDNPDFPAIEITGGLANNTGVDATAELELGEIVFKVGAEIPLTADGDNITVAGTVELDNAHSGGQTTPPTFTLTVDAGTKKATKLEVATAGSGGYTQLPTLKYTGGTQTTAPTIGDVSNAMMNAKPKASLKLLTKGSGYTTAPTVALNPANAGTTGATAVLSTALNTDGATVDVRGALNGTMNYKGIDLTVYQNQGGTVVGAVPIEFLYNRSAGGTTLNRFWVSYEKTFSMLNGQANIGQA